MDLLKKNIHMDRIRSEAVTQITLEDDRNIPESKPDVSNINLEKAEVIIEEIKPGTDSVSLRGHMHFEILYHTQESGSSLVPFGGDIPFEEKLIMKGVMPSDTVEASGEVEDFSVGIINSRKLSIRSLVTLMASVEELYDEEAPIGIHGDGASSDWLEYRKMPMQLAQIAICKNDIFRIRDEVTLPANYPNIFRILWSTVHLGDVEFKVMEEKLSIQGDVQLFLLYEGEGEDRPVRSFETTMPFSGVLECHGCREGMLPDIHYVQGQQELTVRPDLDGEERCVGIELALDIHIRIYEEDTTEILSDIYGVTKEVHAQTHRVTLNRIRSCVTGKTKVTDHIRIPSGGAGILQLLHSSARVASMQQSTVENGILLQGGILVKVMYITGDDADPYACVDAQIPYHYTLEVPGISQDDTGKVHAEVEQLQVTMLDGEEMDVKAILCFNTMVFEKVPVDLISQVEVTEPDSALMNSLPGMVIYVVKAGDNLWNIGRKYYVSVEKIRELNNLVGDDLQIGQKLLIVKGG
ncbi:MAG: DUF3794 domain-containing protein [Butyrivibrio sp.]|nr:DUF3794 domain-containing protein [Muribaculum sp.]MCM1552634.1 DUF3794 domain-containing protein [Butyrivibrio sp.]